MSFLPKRESIMESPIQLGLYTDRLLVVSCQGRVLGYNQKFLRMWNIVPALVGPSSAMWTTG